VMAVHSLGKEGQRRGLIFLWIGHGANHNHQASSSVCEGNGFQYMSLVPLFPIKVRAVHACHDDERFTQLWNRMVVVASAHQAVRFQSHFGTLSACLQSLRGYGIPKEILPLDEQGNLEVTYFCESLLGDDIEMNGDRAGNPSVAESPARRNPSICVPEECDILLGRGNRGHKFRGNQLFWKAIAENYDAYNSSSISRREKQSILHLVYFYLLQCGCRFLVPAPSGSSNGDPTEWIGITEEQAMERIATRMKNSRRKGGTARRLDRRGGSDVTTA
jgi:hypothetical protein